MAKQNNHDSEVEIKARVKDGEEWKEWSKEVKKSKSRKGGNTAGALGFAGFIGSLIYWWQAATNFGAVVTGFLKSCVWPAYIVYHLLVSFYGKVR